MDEKKCSIENCERSVKCKGLCHKHYNRTAYNSKNQSAYDRSPKRRYERHKRHCERMSIPFAITFNDWQKITQSNKCFYCPNTLPTNGIALDRKYPDIGYFLDNVVPCCKDCNFTKGDRFSHIEFKIMMDALNEFRKRLQKTT